MGSTYVLPTFVKDMKVNQFNVTRKSKTEIKKTQEEELLG